MLNEALGPFEIVTIFDVLGQRRVPVENGDPNFE